MEDFSKGLLGWCLCSVLAFWTVGGWICPTNPVGDLFPPNGRRKGQIWSWGVMVAVGKNGVEVRNF